MNNQHCLVIIAGPTAIGKTSLTIDLASHYDTAIISADSRQIFRELKIGSAMPDEEELKKVPHHFIAELSITDPYTVADYERSVLERLEQLFQKHKIVFLTGGSGLYINAVTKGFDEMPEADPQLREMLASRLKDEGLESLANEVRQKDPEAAEKMDLQNPQRVIRALEIMHSTGKKVSEHKTGKPKERNFKIVKVLLDMERDELYRRINERVDNMMQNGLKEEAEKLYPYRHLNALKTVGYKELFELFEGKRNLQEAIALIKQNTRRYAKRQLTWFRNDDGYKTFHPGDKEEIITYIESCCAV